MDSTPHWREALREALQRKDAQRRDSWAARRQVGRSPQRWLRVTPTDQLLAAIEGDGGPIVRARATWRRGVATVPYCPCCGGSHCYTMPRPTALYLPAGCTGALDFLLVDARIGTRAARHSVADGRSA